MERLLVLACLLPLLLHPCGGSEPASWCPYGCQCFTASQLLCADERMNSLPNNISRHVKDFIVMTSSVAYLFAHSLEQSPQLNKLIFLNNALRSIHSQTFHPLTGLQELELSGNPWLEHLFLGTFSKQGNLTKLMLNYNRLKTFLPGMFDALKELEVLQMKGNIISSLPPFLFLHLHNLHLLDLSQNKLEGVEEGTFQGLPRLQVLKMNNNLIGNLTAGMFHNVSLLTELHLEGNRLAQLKKELFSELTCLQVLNLRGNLLTSFSGEVFGSEPSSLKELNLRGNRLTELSSLGHLSSLTDLFLSSNRLSDLAENTFRNVSALEHLDLSDNQLIALPPKLFKDLLVIKALHLHNNNLSSLDAGQFEDQTFVQQLYLFNNQLEDFPRGLLDLLVLQPKVRLHGNPWRCDCSLFYLHDWLQANWAEVELLERVQCERPDFLKHRTVVSVQREQLLCHLSGEESMDLAGCSLRASSNVSVVIKCKVHKCSKMSVQVEFEEDDGTVTENIVKNEPKHHHCHNETMTQDPLQ